MKYILDFDGVIFNTQALKMKMAQLGIEESMRSASLFETLKEQDAQGDISSFVFADAVSFIKTHSDNCYVVSSYVSTNPLNNQDAEVQEEYQRTKINLSGVTALVGEDHVHVVGESKREALQQLKNIFDSKNEVCIFIDDRKVYVDEARTLGITAIWMDKSISHGVEDAYVIDSFDALEEKLAIWKQ